MKKKKKKEKKKKKKKKKLPLEMNKLVRGRNSR